jgi:hypothetical protein
MAKPKKSRGHDPFSEQLNIRISKPQSLRLRRFAGVLSKQSGLPVTEQMVIRKLIDELEEAS